MQIGKSILSTSKYWQKIKSNTLMNKQVTEQNSERLRGSLEMRKVMERVGSSSSKLNKTAIDLWFNWCVII